MPVCDHGQEKELFIAAILDWPSQMSVTEGYFEKNLTKCGIQIVRIFSVEIKAEKRQNLSRLLGKHKCFNELNPR